MESEIQLRHLMFYASKNPYKSLEFYPTQLHQFLEIL